MKRETFQGLFASSSGLRQTIQPGFLDENSFRILSNHEQLLVSRSGLIPDLLFVGNPIQLSTQGMSNLYQPYDPLTF